MEDRFWQKMEKLVEIWQTLWMYFKFFLFSGEMYPLAPISNGISLTLCVLISEIKWEYFSSFLEWAEGIFGSKGTVSSRIRTLSSFITIMSGLSAVTHRSGGTVPPPGREKVGMSENSVHFDLSTLSQIYLRMLLCLQVYLC